MGSVFQQTASRQTARDKRGKWVRRRVARDHKLPASRASFLLVNDNKSELFHFLAEYVEQVPNIVGKQLFATKSNNVLTYPQHMEITHLAPCTHQEADTRIFLHAVDAVNHGHQKITIRTVDKAIVILAISLVSQIHLTEV